jgi:small redox-active disulfide protein 2
MTGVERGNGEECRVKIEVLGSGCRKCMNLYESAKTAVEEMGLDAAVEKVTDMMTIISYGVMSTPALVIDGQVVSSGRIPSKEEIVKMLRDRSGK